jgi:hypothetical protein
MLRIYHVCRIIAASRPSWRIIVPLVLAADLGMAAIAWVVVGLVMS